MSRQQNADTHSLAQTKWNCKYHIILHRSIGEKYSTKGSDWKSKSF